MSSVSNQSGRVKVLTMLTSFQIGGTERQVVNVALGLDRSRFDLHLASIHHYGALLREVESLDVPHASFPIASLYHFSTLRQALRLARYMRQHRIQIVHTYGLYTNLFAIPAAKLAGVPVIVSSIRDRGDILTRAQRWFQRQVCRLADCILVNAEAIRETLIQQGYCADSIAVIRNGIVPSKFRSSPGTSTIRQELGLPASAPVVLVLSRLNPMKGVEYFLDAAAALARDLPEVRFLVVGDGLHKVHLEEHAASLGIADRVLFTGFRTDIAQLLSEASLSVLPSLSEGLSNTLLESMAAGVPVVATCVGGNPEVIEDGVSGLLVPPRNAGALAAAMNRLLRDSGLASAIREAARRRIGELFSMHASIRQVEDLYLKMIESPKTYLAEAAVP
jgi:glycosyltransferase involved in cell wall biosynthesis